MIFTIFFFFYNFYNFFFFFWKKVKLLLISQQHIQITAKGVHRTTPLRVWTRSWAKLRQYINKTRKHPNKATNREYTLSTSQPPKPLDATEPQQEGAERGPHSYTLRVCACITLLIFTHGFYCACITHQRTILLYVLWLKERLI